MSKIKIRDLPRDMKISRDRMRKVFGGDLILYGLNASLSGTGGVALLEYAKDAIQTAVSNVSGIGTSTIQARKIVERKLTA
jgi:hypothetical protein